MSERDDDRDITGNYHGGNPESVAAHESVAGDKRRLRAIVLKRIHASGSRGRTCDEIEAETGLRHQTASARVTELKADGTIIDSGMRRATRSGRSAAVYLIAPPQDDEAEPDEKPPPRVLRDVRLVAWGPDTGSLFPGGNFTRDDG